MISKNRMANAYNMFQGADLRVLCVCSAGLLRSPTMARLISRNYDSVNTRAVGISSEYALIPMDLVHLMWADIVLCANTDHYDFTLAALKETEGMWEHPVVYDLEIPDNYAFGDKELEHIISDRLKDVKELKECLIRNS